MYRSLFRMISSSSDSYCVFFQQLRADLMHIIQEKDLKHPLIANFSLSTIKEKVYSMFKSQIKSIPSFLLTVSNWQYVINPHSSLVLEMFMF